MKDIKQIIEKFYNGETSLEEEVQLQDFFQGEDVPDHLKAEQAYFQMKNTLGHQGSTLSEDDLFAKLPEKPAAKMITLNPWISRVAAAAILILVGYGAAQLSSNNDEMDAMKSEMARMKAMMLQQLESSSASGRLQAVNYSFQMSEVDQETIDALVETMLFDKNMHVRTKAVEALVNYGDKPSVPTALAKALTTEEQPAVQISIIAALVKIKDKAAIEDLEKLTEKEDVLQDVRDEAQMSIFKLKEL